MNQATLHRCPEEIAEIERHKYFLSEQAGHDVGWEAAEQDWDANHADQFRRVDTPQSNPAPARGLGTILERLLAKAKLR